MTTVLLVDDDTEVAEAIGDLLTDIGHYRIHLAFSAAQALEFLESYHARVDLMFSDIRLGRGENGFLLAAEVAVLYPHIAIVLTSGYTSAAAECAKHRWPFLIKPVRLKEIVATFDSALLARRNGDRG